MARFGKKVVVSKNMSDFMLGLVAPSGFGKSTLMYTVCDKLYGENGYILLDFGDENGTAALNGAIAERVPTWKVFQEIVSDIVKNKETDYKDLRVVVIDTLDAAYAVCEQYTVATYNREHMGEQNFRPATSINNCEGGFGRGMDRCIEIFKKEIAKLAKVGVGCWWTAHVKEKDQVDLFTGNSFTQLTASMSSKYFNSIKDISHVIGCGYYDRSINTVEVGDANPVTKKKKTRKAMESEERKILFRDSSMVADGKSRFSSIVDEINLSADEWINAIQSAIDAERGDNAVSPAPKKPTKKPPVANDPDDDLPDKLKAVVESAEEDESAPTEDDIDIFEEGEASTADDPVITLDTERMNAIRMAFKNSESSVKAAVKSHLVAYGNKLSDTMHLSDINAIEQILGLSEEV